MESLKNKKLVILGMKSIMCKFKGVERIFFFFFFVGNVSCIKIDFLSSFVSIVSYSFKWQRYLHPLDTVVFPP